MVYSFSELSTCGRQIITIDIVFTPITVLILVLRFWSARYSRRRLGIDDILAVLAWIVNGALTGYASWGIIVSGLGKHASEITPEMVLGLVPVFLVAEFIYLIGTALVKMSMLCLLHRIYTTPKFRRWCYAVMALDAIYLISFIPIFLTNCVPLSQYWDPKPTGWCRNTIKSDSATVAFNLLLDFSILILPLPVLWHLQMSLRDKLTVTSMFSIGLVTIALVFWRLAETVKTRSTPDWTYSLCTVGEIATLEIHLGIICICIPTLGPLFNAYLKPAWNRLPMVKNSKSDSSMLVKNPDLVTFGGSNSKSNKRSQGHTDFSMDRTIVGPEESMKLTPSMNVVSECTSYPVHDGYPSHHTHDEIFVKRDIESIYQCKECKDREFTGGK
ncbi:hypothetical protein GGR50DRAFT_376425 [Xylaria sp. CBS 124048]|nr:hypothetical protein GGR50DRAFT_376425 [Xylaria sp. CBS 124048]